MSATGRGSVWWNGGVLVRGAGWFGSGVRGGGAELEESMVEADGLVVDDPSRGLFRVDRRVMTAPSVLDAEMERVK